MPARALEATNVDIGSTDVERLVQFAKSERIDLTVVGPEASLVAGVVDAFQAANLRIFGPTKKAAELEGSKIFSKELMRKANVPTAEFHSFSRHQDAVTFLEDREETPLVVKADGLASGKESSFARTAKRLSTRSSRSCSNKPSESRATKS